MRCPAAQQGGGGSGPLLSAHSAGAHALNSAANAATGAGAGAGGEPGPNSPMAGMHALSPFAAGGSGRALHGGHRDDAGGGAAEDGGGNAAEGHAAGGAGGGLAAAALGGGVASTPGTPGRVVSLATSRLRPVTDPLSQMLGQLHKVRGHAWGGGRVREGKHAACWLVAHVHLCRQGGGVPCLLAPHTR